MALDQVNGEPVGQCEDGGFGQYQRALRAGLGRRGAPCLRGLKLRRVLRSDLDVGVGVIRAARHIVEHFLARHAVDHHAVIFAQGGLGHLLHAGRGDGVVAGQIFGQVAGVAGVLVVVVELVGDAAEAAEPLEAGDEAGFNLVARPLDLFGGGTVRS